ncbi:hypothetical protein A6E15_07595 [Natrinema saccharevitans]|uniref:Methyltransferase domain-containing protein n=1 Tax=Natrinema saccharevitans TaxID=301967 RepID=A0A1S8AWA1_9EURY|nr:class I SAM-dependent methyltransferase [Natrinema saccharevitans]OLZ40861.1 hypothetical protein A6E15_07595 [Natrinema saccharevitans]
MGNWVEDVYLEKSDLFAEVLERYDDLAGDEVEIILDRMKEEYGVEPESVLDVGCGLGRHVLAFGKRGYEVDGFDFSREYVREARQRASDRDLDDRVSIHQHDMRNLEEWDDSYDLIVNFFETFNYYGRETDQVILSDIFDLLSDDGVFAVEMTNKSNLIHDFKRNYVSEYDDSIYVIRVDFDVESGIETVTNDVFWKREDGFEYRDRMVMKHHLYSPSEFGHMCKRAGFEDITIVPRGAEELTIDVESVVILAS